MLLWGPMIHFLCDDRVLSPAVSDTKRSDSFLLMLGLSPSVRKLDGVVTLGRCDNDRIALVAGSELCIILAVSKILSQEQRILFVPSFSFLHTLPFREF